MINKVVMEDGKGAQKKELWGTVQIEFYLLTFPRIVFTSCKLGECPSIPRILNDSPGWFLSEIRLLAMTWSDLNLAYLRSVTSLWPLAPSDVQPWTVINKIWFHFLKSKDMVLATCGCWSDARIYGLFWAALLFRFLFIMGRIAPV